MLPFIFFYPGFLWVLLGLQLHGSSGGSNEETDRCTGSSESTEPHRLQHHGWKLWLQGRLHLQSLQLRHPQHRRGFREILPVWAKGCFLESTWIHLSGAFGPHGLQLELHYTHWEIIKIPPLFRTGNVVTQLKGKLAPALTFTSFHTETKKLCRLWWRRSDLWPWRWTPCCRRSICTEEVRMKDVTILQTLSRRS